MSEILNFFNSMKKYVDIFDDAGSITTDQLDEIIKEHEPVKKELLNKYGRYMLSEEDTPIFSRELKTESQKINNKLANDYYSEVIDTKVGYMIGIPITYGMSDGELDEKINYFNIDSDVEDLDSETIKFMGICGFSSRLLYNDAEDEEASDRVKRINPWETIFFYNDTMANPSYALRYYQVDDENIEVVFYTPKDFTVFKQTKGRFGSGETKTHPYEGCPLFGCPNNAELLGDFDRVNSLIEAFDRSLSDVNSEIEQFRLAYMYVKDMDIPKEYDENGNEIEVNFIDLLLKTGLVELGENGEIGFITKQLNDTVVENHLNRIENRIYKGSKTPNFTDKEFGGNLTGVALKYKLFDIETKSRIAELKLKKSLRYQYKLLANSLGIRNGGSFEPRNLTFKFTRNIAVDIKDEAEAVMKLKGIISDETLVGLLSFIENAANEIEKKRLEDEEKMNYMPEKDLDSDEDGNEDQNQEEDDEEEEVE